MTRTLRAIAERRDTYDRLIDAVIAWESLFGAVTDSTLRVCGSLARLLHDTDADREAGYNRYKKVYDARSKIVHANSKQPELAEVEAYGRTAIDASLKVIEKLLTTHLSLLSLESSQRSQQVLLGGETFGT
jgi:Apea-like HEPN